MRRSLRKSLQKSFQTQNHLFNYKRQPHHIKFINTSHVYSITCSNFKPRTHHPITTLARIGYSKQPELLPQDLNTFNPVARLNGYDLLLQIHASTDLGLDSHCHQLHGCILKSGFASNVSVSNALLRFYVRAGPLCDAHKLFVESSQRSVVSWNTLLSGYLHLSQFRKTLEVFLQLERSELCADAYSFTLALSASGQLEMLLLGRSIHSKIVRCGLECGIVVSNCLIDMYGKCGSVEEAIRVFDEMVDKDNISWNSVIAASTGNRRLDLAYSFLCQMPKPDTISYNELINGIAQFGDIKDAIEVLANMTNPNSSSWNSIIKGYVNRNQAREALDLFTKMHSGCVEMDEYTFSIILSGVACLAALTWGMLLHCCTVKCGLDVSVVVGSALIDMYSKCGQVRDARVLFQCLPNKNLICWNAMISGYAHNGDSHEAILLFEAMKMVKNLKPDWVSFINVIATCSNSELPFQKAVGYFESMINENEIAPTVEHCCSIIRLMGHRGELRWAKRMIYGLDFQSSAVVWRAFLGACGTCRNMRVGNIAAAKLIQLEGDDDYFYVTISNLLAFYGRWIEVSKLRKLMRERGVRKEVGYSWIELERVAS